MNLVDFKLAGHLEFSLFAVCTNALECLMKIVFFRGGIRESESGKIDFYSDDYLHKAKQNSAT